MFIIGIDPHKGSHFGRGSTGDRHCCDEPGAPRCTTLPSGSRTLATRSPHGSFRGPSSGVAPAAVSFANVSSTSST